MDSELEGEEGELSLTISPSVKQVMVFKEAGVMGVTVDTVCADRTQLSPELSPSSEPMGGAVINPVVDRVGVALVSCTG